MEVSVVIINYNTFELTYDCVASVIKHTSGITYEIIVVDNASKEFDKELFKESFPQVNLIESKTNLGFAGGNNLGIKEAIGKYILLLNSDTLFTENVIKALFEYMELHPTAAASSPKLVFPDGRVQSVCQRFPSIKYSLFQFFRLQKVFRKKSGKILLGSFFDQKSLVRPDWIWGTCFFFRKELLTKLPGKKLDDKFFMYCEDMQWCMDFRRLGYEIHYCPQVAVIHLMGGSSADKLTIMKKNNKLFLERNYPPFQVKWINRLNKWLS
jgi:GT2 family glycosyltransferase